MLRDIMKKSDRSELDGSQSQSQSRGVYALHSSWMTVFWLPVRWWMYSMLVDVQYAGGCTVHWWKHLDGVAECEPSPGLLSYTRLELCGEIWILLNHLFRAVGDWGKEDHLKES